MELWRGAPVAARIYETEQPVLAALAEKGVKPTLAVVRVGEREDDLSYERGLKKAAGDKIDLKIVALPEDVSADEFNAALADLNEDNAVHGILIFRPLPKPLRGEVNLEAAIAPEKDVDAFHPVNVGRLITSDYRFVPCTPAGIIEILRYYNIRIEGQKCVVIGRSNIVGKPMALLLLENNGTVSVCHSKTADLKAETLSADIIVCAVGKADFLKADMVKDGAVVIDVGMNRNRYGKLCGDVDFENVEKKASYITPVPGGVGPMTITMLLENTLRAAKHGI